jgi:hypothetical protein
MPRKWSRAKDEILELLKSRYGSDVSSCPNSHRRVRRLRQMMSVFWQDSLAKRKDNMSGDVKTDQPPQKDIGRLSCLQLPIEAWSIVWTGVPRHTALPEKVRRALVSGSVVLQRSACQGVVRNGVISGDAPDLARYSKRA